MQASEAIYGCMLSAFMHHGHEVNLHSFPSHNFTSARIEAAIADQLEECHKKSIPSHVRWIFSAITNMFWKLMKHGVSGFDF